MAKKIEILENTLLKLLVRRGDDQDRLNVTLSEGELGYTVDGKRLFVGDGQTVGGIVVGNKWKGAVNDIDTITDALIGDYAFETGSDIYYVRNTDSSWLSAGRVLTPGDTTIVIDDSNGTVIVGTISGENVHPNALGNSIDLSNNKISLSSTQIKTDRVSAHTASHLSLPQAININNTDYNFPTGGLGAGNAYLRTDANGNLRWSSVEANSSIYFNSSAAALPVGTILPAASEGSMPGGYLLCNGQSILGSEYPDLSAVIGNNYGGDDVNFNVPDYSNATLYGDTTDPDTGTEYHLGTGTSGISAKAVTYFIKALADNVATSQFSVAGTLTLSADGIEQDPGTVVDTLNNTITIGTVMPGITAFDTYNTNLSGYKFETQATFTKFWLTGTGGKGGGQTGGAAATVYGILSAPIGTDFYAYVGEGPTSALGAGRESYIYYLSDPDDTSSTKIRIATSFGAHTPMGYSGVTNTGNLSTNGTGLADGESPYVIGGHIIPGASGGGDTNNGGEELNGSPSFWGGEKVAGAGTGGHNGLATGDPADGFVKFEWGM